MPHYYDVNGRQKLCLRGPLFLKVLEYRSGFLHLCCSDWIWWCMIMITYRVRNVNVVIFHNTHLFEIHSRRKTILEISVTCKSYFCSMYAVITDTFHFPMPHILMTHYFLTMHHSGPSINPLLPHLIDFHHHSCPIHLLWKCIDFPVMHERRHCFDRKAIACSFVIESSWSVWYRPMRLIKCRTRVITDAEFSGH